MQQYQHTDMIGHMTRLKKKILLPVMSTSKSKCGKGRTSEDVWLRSVVWTGEKSGVYGVGSVRVFCPTHLH